MLNPIQFADKHLYPYTMKGEEITPLYCPYCKGGSHRDKQTFSLNIEKEVFKCLRGSCGKEGHFTELLKDFGEEVERMNNFEIAKPKKTYKKPEVKPESPSDKVFKYLELRKISRETAEKRKVGEHKGNIIFPYYDENGEHVFNKFRPAKKVKKGEMKAWREADTKPVLWGMELVDRTKPLIITEGEMDSLALEEAGVYNSVSVPSGTQDFDWVDTCWDWLQDFDRIILCGDSDEAGQEMVKKLINKLGEEKCYIVDNPYKDANELLFRDGPEAVREMIDGARPVPFAGLIDLADVVPKDESQIPKIKTNIEWIDKLIGGWLPGELTIWTGKRGEGKSTFLGQMLLEAIHEGEPVVAYSGELTAQRFQNWIHLQATGERHIQYRVDEVTQKTYPYIDKAIHQKIRDWYRGKFFLFDNSINFEHSEENSIIKVFTYAVKRYDCKLFMVDNLMTARFDGLNDSDYYRRQSNFVGELVRFAKAYDVHVHLVAHPKKTNPQDDLDNDSISGTADITNRADNVIAIKRLKEPIMNTSGYRADATLTILKNRSDGVMNESLALAFDTASKRFYNPMDPKSKDKVYGWEKRKVVKEVEREIPPWEE